MKNVQETLLALTKSRFFVENPNQEERPRPAGIHASEVSKCMRRMAYTITGTERVRKVPAVWYRRLRAGQMSHDMLQEQLAAWAKRIGADHGTVTFEAEVPIHPGIGGLAAKWNIYSHADGVISLGGYKVVVEIKSKSDGEYSKMTKPEVDHVEQAHVYMACLGVQHTWFIYYNKSNQNYTAPEPPYFIDFDPKVWASLEERFEKVLATIAEGNLPQRTEGIYCEFCSYGHTCEPQYLLRKRSWTK